MPNQEVDLQAEGQNAQVPKRFTDEQIVEGLKRSLVQFNKWFEMATGTGLYVDIFREYPEPEAENRNDVWNPRPVRTTDDDDIPISNWKGYNLQVRRTVKFDTELV